MQKAAACAHRSGRANPGLDKDAQSGILKLFSRQGATTSITGLGIR